MHARVTYKNNRTLTSYSAVKISEMLLFITSKTYLKHQKDIHRIDPIAANMEIRRTHPLSICHMMSYIASSLSIFFCNRYIMIGK
jgi:hypothetical protein